MICKLFSCRVFNLTSCDFVYVFSILSLIVELTRITPIMKQFNYYSLDEYDEEYQLDNSEYWIHKLFDSFIEFIIFIRVVHSVIRTVLYYIYGQEFRQEYNEKKLVQKKDSIKKCKPKTNKKFKHTYQQTAINDNENDDNICENDYEDDDEDEDESESESSNENDIKEPEPTEQIVIQPTIMDNCDTTEPLPSATLPPPLHNKSVDLLHTNTNTNSDYNINININNEEYTPKQSDQLLNKLKLNIQSLTPVSPHQPNININMLSPPQVEIDPSDVDTQSIERLDVFPAFEPHKQIILENDDESIENIILENDSDEIIDKKDATNNDIMHEHNQNGDSWGIFPMFASKLGIVIDLCISFILLFDHRYLFIVRICIFGVTFILLMYISSQHFIEFIRSFLENNQLQLNPDNTIRSDNMSQIMDDINKQPLNGSSDNIIDRDIIKENNDAIIIENQRRLSEIVYTEPRMTKQIKSIILNPNININNDNNHNNNNNNNNNTQPIILNPWDINNDNTSFEYGNNYADNDIEFRTGQDEIKGIVRNMLNTPGDNTITYEMRDKLNGILSILQDIDVMDKGNIEEKIELDPEIDLDTKRFLAQTLLSKHSMKDNYNTPRFDFGGVTSTDDNNKAILITPVTSHDTMLQQTVSPPKDNNKLAVLDAITPHNIIEIDEKYNEKENDEYKDEQDNAYDNNNKYEIDILPIIEEIQSNEENFLKLQHISPAIDKLTEQIFLLDGSIDIIELNNLCGRPLLLTSMCIFIKYDFCNKCNICISKFYNFILFIEKSYKIEKYNPYHNRMHATEVMLATMIFISCLEDSVREMISNLQIFTAFISAIIHDVDHPGNNNAFEINTESPLSILYSDQSVLEYHHLKYTFGAIKKKKEIDFTFKWDKQTKKEFRKQCIYSVLATDLSKHFITISHIKQLKLVKENDLEYVFKSIIKMSDLSHVTKPLQQHKQWTDRITNEFHNQGDKEMKCGLDVSPLCNKQNKKIAKGQVGFIKHVVSPLYIAAQRFFLKNSKFDKSILHNLNLNRKYWEDEAKKEETPFDTQYSLTNKDTPTPGSQKQLSPVKLQNKRIQKQRPLSATFANTKIAILTNLQNTPPPILPSSVRNVSHHHHSTGRNNNNIPFKPSFGNINKRFFASPSNKSNKSNKSDIGKGFNGTINMSNIHFSNYNNIKHRKRIRSSSANSLELPNFVISNSKINNNNNTKENKIKETLSDILTPTSLLRLGSNKSNISPMGGSCKSTNEIFKSLTPKYTKIKTNNSQNYTKSIPIAISPNMMHYKQHKIDKKKNKNNIDSMLRTKSNDIVSSENKKINSTQVIKYSKSDINTNINDNNIALHIISPKQFTSPYSISHDVSSGLLSKNDNNNNNNNTSIIIHEEKSSSDSQQRFKFNDNVIQESK